MLSFAILFLEMASIRWLNASIPVLAYFANVVLISCFLGLGVGCLLARRSFDLVRIVPWLFLLNVLTLIFLKNHSVQISYTGDYLFVEHTDANVDLIDVSYGAFVGFVVNVAFFGALGQELGRRIEAIGDPLRAYAWDIAGSLLGVLAYTLLAWLRTPPWAWFLTGLLLALTFVPRPREMALGVVAIGVAVFFIARDDEAIWSPNYKVEARSYDVPGYPHAGYAILVDNVRIQDAIRFSPEIASSPLAPWVTYYDLPYKLVQPKSVLVLGAGTGNEIVFAQQHGVERIVAVEIDPVIASYGDDLHPHRPYAQENVEVVVEDARSFISRTDEKFDLILISALDSHKQLPGLSSLRLESFIYTEEAFATIREHLAPGGVFIFNHISSRPWMAPRIYWTLTDAFGRPPLRLGGAAMPFGSVAFIYAPPEVEQKIVFGAPPVQPERTPDIRNATDDWPFLYLERNRVPSFTLTVLIILVLASFLVVGAVSKGARRPNLHFFMLGAGFMLLETRAIAELALLFGATWWVNAIVFISILATILLANHLVRRKRTPSVRVVYLLLFVSLAAVYVLPLDVLLSVSIPVRFAAIVFIVGLPLLWASLVFSSSFATAAEPDRALGSNLIGIVFGGSLEYASNVFGLDALYLVAIGLYLLSFLAISGVKQSAAPPA